MKKYFATQFFILAVIVTFFSINSFGQINKERFSEPNSIADTKVTAIQPNYSIETVLYNQTTGTTTSGISSQDFETVNNAYDSYCADNFTVSGGPWNINQVVVGGFYSASGGPAVGFNVYFYQDASGVPGTQVYSAMAQPYTFDGTTYYTITLSTAAVLANGNYWISVQSRMDFGSGGQWYWRTVSGSFGSVAHWQNPGGGFGVCPSWAPITTCNSSTNTDMSFSLHNIAGPGPATDPNPANNAVLISLNPNLSWTNPSGTTTNSVHFGTDPGSLSQVYSGPAISSLPVSSLNYFTQYYWRVDESDGGGTTAGTVWTFRTIWDPSTIITLPYSQSFSFNYIPEFWAEAYESGLTSNKWSISASSFAGGSPNEMVCIWVDELGTRRLIVGPINTTGIAALALEFKHFFDDFGAGLTVKIQSSVNGTTWTDEAFSFSSGGGNIGPATVNTVIANNVGSTTYIAFVTDGNQYEMDAWVIDDVVITNALQNDAGTISVDLSSVYPVGVVTPKATVLNYGSSVNTFNVQMTISGGYSSTKTVTNLAPGASFQVTFDEWNAVLGLYNVEVCTQLGSDQNTSNDCAYTNVSIVTGTWANGSVYPTETYLGSGVGYNSPAESSTGYLFSIGGNTTSLLGTECYKYNTVTNSWTPIASLPEGRRVLATALVGDFIYAIGGSNMISVYQSTVYKYDITGNSWTTVAPLPIAAAWGKAVGYNNYIYFAGGVNSGGDVLSSIYVYDVLANTWTPGTSMPGPKFGGAFSISGNKLVYVAGVDEDVISNIVYVGTIDPGNPLVIAWTTAEKTFPGLEKEIPLLSKSDLLASDNKSWKKEKSFFNPTEAAAYPPGSMFRFDGATWGSNGIIVANGSPAAAWVPANPNPCYVYIPSTDTWIQQSYLPIPVLGASLGTVNDGTTWKLIVASGLDTNLTQIYSDELGSSQTTFSFSFNVFPNKWNMVSAPGINPAGMGTTNWWPNLTGNVWGFNGTIYQSTTTTTPGKGYWMKHAGVQTSYNYSDIQIVSHDPIPGHIGWNIIGVFENNVTTSALSTNPAGQITGAVWGFNGTIYVNMSANPLEPGYGYWVKLLSACDIIIPGGSLAKVSGETVSYYKEDWGRIILTDAAGISYTLYAVNSESSNGGASIDLDQYEMPPLPPGGSFDVRFSSGRVAEDINNSVKMIDMQGITYPLTVRAENMDIRLMDETGKLLNVYLKKGEDVVINESAIQKLVVTGELIPEHYSLNQNYPNPFNPSTIIEFSLPEQADVKLTIYSILGEKVAELVNTSLTAGKYRYQWDAGNVAAGMYLYELSTDKFVSVKKMMLLK